MIEKHIPMPDFSIKHAGIQWGKLEIGDSVIINQHAQAYMASKYHHPKTFKPKRQPDGSIRAWRTH